MADHETYPFDADFDAFRASLIPHVTPAGPDAVRHTVRRRRRIAVATAAVAALVLVVGPVAGYAALNRGQGPPPAPGATLTPTDPTGPSTGPSAGPSATPTGTPNAPDGRISKADLLGARLTLPPWQPDAPSSCLTRNVRLVDGTTTRQTPPSLMRLSYADVDGDGAQESVAILGCRPGEAAMQQVVAFDRDQRGRIVTLGQVVRTSTLAQYTSEIAWITDVQASTAGSVRVQVGDMQPCCSSTDKWVQRQWRTYGWTGSRFEQTAGPTRFDPNPLFTDLRVTATDVVFTERPNDWWRHATITVTIRNAGPSDADVVNLTLEFGPAKMRHEGAGWSACTEVSDTADVPGQSLSCRLGPLRAGEQRTLVLGLANSLPQPDQGTGQALVQRPDGQHDIPDLKFTDNHDGFKFR
jgi:hypothetical protein